MELILTLTDKDEAGTLVSVACNGQISHTFLRSLLPDSGHPRTEASAAPTIEDPISYGQALYQGLFPVESVARQVLDGQPERILLVTGNDVLDAIPWEYVYGPYGSDGATGFLVLECPFVRGLPAEKRIPPPDLARTDLHIVVVPSKPLSRRLAPLDIEGEWIRLRESVENLSLAITLERTHPPTIEQLRALVANQRHRVIHFTGHGGQNEHEAILCFERENGSLDEVTARRFAQRVRGTTFLVVLSACESATPGETYFSNLAAVLVRQKTPYALGMRFRVSEDDASIFTQAFYRDLTRGVPVEDALFQARLSLSSMSKRPWVIGVPVLYTALDAPSGGFAARPGTPTILPSIEGYGLTRTEGEFQGRIDELQTLGSALTGDRRPQIMTIHGAGGQGKTALARETAERFGWAWPGGVWATTLEKRPTRETFLANLARFLVIDIQQVVKQEDAEAQVLKQLHCRRTLIVLDNAETLVEAVKAKDAAAIQLGRFLQQLPDEKVSLLVTSRDLLEWSGEDSLELGGLLPQDGATLFRQSAPQRSGEIMLKEAAQLSQNIGGYPLGLLLLGRTFNESAIPWREFFKNQDAQLLKAENKYLGEDHRHYRLYSCFDTSVRYLNGEMLALFGKLALLHAPFLPETAFAIFDPTYDPKAEARSPIADQLYQLYQRGLLVRETTTLSEGTLLLYRLLPPTRAYIEGYLAQEARHEDLLARFGAAYALLVRWLHNELNRDSRVAFIAEQSREDIERGTDCVKEIEQGFYYLRWGWVLHRLGNPKRGLALIEQALEIAQQLTDTGLKLEAFNTIGLVYTYTGQPQEALRWFDQALTLMRDVGNHDRKAMTLNNIGGVYDRIGQPSEALKWFRQALTLARKVGDQAGEAAALNNIGRMSFLIGQPSKALMQYYEQALTLAREVEDHDGEAIALINIAEVYQDFQRYTEALAYFEQSIEIAKNIKRPANKVNGLVGLALLLYRHLNRTEEAIVHMEQAIKILRDTGLPQDAAGRTPARLQTLLDAMCAGSPLGGQTDSSPTMTAEDQHIIDTTVTVMTVAQDRHAEWREVIANELHNGEQQGNVLQIDRDFFSAILAILDGQTPVLPTDHPYAQAVAAILEDITKGEQSS